MAYYLTTPFEVSSIAFKFDIKVDWPSDQVLAGLPVPERAVKNPILVSTRRTNLPDLVHFEAYYTGVSEAALTLLTEFAADDIATFPIVIESRKLGPVYGKYFYLNVLAYRDSLILDELNYREQRMGSSGTIRIVDHSKLRMRKDRIRGAHIWHETYPQVRRRHELFASDELVEKARSRGLSGFEKVVPIPEI